MTRLNYFGILSLTILGLAAACNDDEDAQSSTHPGAAGEAGRAGAGAAGAPDQGGSHADAGSSSMSGAGPEPGGSDAGGAPPAAAGDGGAAGASGGDSQGGAGAGGAGWEAISGSKVLDLNDVASHPESYAWQDFRPNVLKLFLAGAAETQHIAVLWYTVTDAGVGLHYHAKTESVYVIDGSQTDAKGVYTDGTVYFNPPESGHQITNSGGFFLLAYAAPPDFVNTNLIQPYEPVRIDTTAADLTTSYAFVEQSAGIQTYTVPLDVGGGMTAQLIESSSSTAYGFEGNYVLVLKGSCDIEGVTLAAGNLVVADDIVPQPYAINAPSSSTCLAMGVSF